MSCPLTSGRPAGSPPRLEILVPRASDRKRLLQELSVGKGSAPRLVRTGRYRGRGGLTARQDEALRVAYSLGFLSYPRRAGLKEVAGALGVSRSTALELLRRATTQLSAERFGDELRVPRLS